MRSGLNRALLRTGEAASDLYAGLTLLDQRTQGAPDQSDLKLHFTAQLAGFEYYLGRYEVAERLLDGARMLTHEVPAALLDAATVEWIQTHLHRLRGRPEEAMRTSLAAATVFTESGSAISAARAQALVADSVMDFVPAFEADADRGAILKLAWPHLSMATSLAREAQDPIGRLMIQLTRIRYGRLRQSNENRIAMIENVIHKARKLGDPAVVAEAFTSLGDELLASGERDSAHNLYQQVLAMLDGGDFPAVGLQARRALMRGRDW
jgi:tetratricopeptide (TPR) repeat protein